MERDLRTSIRPTIAEVSLGAIARNVDRISTRSGRAAVWAVIKADAYGHGALPIARMLGQRCPALAVSLVEEALELRAGGIGAPLMVLSAYYDHCHAQVLEEGLTPVVYDPGDLELFSRAASARGRRADIHLKIDTGMNRLGIVPEQLPGALERVARLGGLRIAGLCTHFACADAPAVEETEQAVALFQRCVDAAMQRGLGPLTNHAANSAAALRFPQTRFDAVRPGLAIYGALPSAAVSLPGLEPALRLSTRVMAIRQVPVGGTVSYGGLWRAARASRVAILPVGYADGYPRHVRGAETLVRGRRAPVVGAICMDMMMVDVTDVPGVTVGDDVALIGAGPDGAQGIADRITVDDLARWAGTINYEILAGISKRVPRVYKD